MKLYIESSSPSILFDMLLTHLSESVYSTFIVLLCSWSLYSCTIRILFSFTIYLMHSIALMHALINLVMKSSN